MTELETIHLALENLQKNAQIKGKWKAAAQTKAFDGELTFTIETKTIKYNVEIKNELRGHQFNHILALNKKHPPLMMVVARLFPKIKEELRHTNIAYLEANGNIFLKHKEILLWIDANKPVTIKKNTGSRAFTKTGLKVVFEFLRDETWINKTYRQIADHAGTAIGNINNIITGLLQEGFLLPVAKNKYKLNNRQDLLNKWVAAYDVRLKPTLKTGTFRFLKEEDFANWKNMPLRNGKTWWGGEPAGDLLTNYLRPAELTLYTTETRNDLIRNYRLIPDEKGNVKACKKFWAHDEANNNTVPPLLVYADLINTNDRRCIETAQKIYDEFLQN